MTTPRKAAVSFTGGKDSMTVLHMMQAPQVAQQASECWANADWRTDLHQRLDTVAGCQAVLLVTFVPSGPRQPFKAHPLELVQLQAQALGLSHLIMEVDAAPTFLDSYRANILRLREEHGVEVLATGDILDVCSSFMPRAAAGTGVQLLSPLWGIERGLLLETVWSYGMKPVITCVNVTKFGISAKKEQREEGTAAKEDWAGAAGAQLGSGRGKGAAPAARTEAAVEGPGGGDVARTDKAVTEESCDRATDGKMDGAQRKCQATHATAAGPESCADGLAGGASLLGRELDRKLHRELLMPAVRLYGVDECGEWGEYHTMVTGSCLFAEPLRLTFDVRQEGEYAFLALTVAELGR